MEVLGPSHENGTIRKWMMETIHSFSQRSSPTSPHKTLRPPQMGNGKCVYGQGTSKLGPLSWRPFFYSFIISISSLRNPTIFGMTNHAEKMVQAQYGHHDFYPHKMGNCEYGELYLTVDRPSF